VSPEKSNTFVNVPWFNVTLLDDTNSSFHLSERVAAQVYQSTNLTFLSDKVVYSRLDSK